MIDRYILPKVQELYIKPAQYLVAKGIGADQLSILGFFIGMLALPLLVYQFYLIALVCILLNSIIDGLDGAVARQTQTTDAGAFLDICLDFIFYQAVALGFALSDISMQFWGSILMLCYTGTGVSFLSFAIFAEKHRIKKIVYPNKGIYFISGLTEGTETIVYIALCCLFPLWFNTFTIVFIILCIITTITRIVYGVKQLTHLDKA